MEKEFLENANLKEIANSQLNDGKKDIENAGKNVGKNLGEGAILDLPNNLDSIKKITPNFSDNKKTYKELNKKKLSKALRDNLLRRKGG